MKVSEYEMPEGLFYSDSYAWVKREDHLIRIGVIDFAVKLAGKIEYVDLPPTGEHYEKDEIFGTVESGKWVGEMLMPVAGEIIGTNNPLLDRPAPVYDDPYGGGWLIIVKPDTMDDLSLLMSDPKEIKTWLEQEIKATEKIKK
ncbi:MAG: glycine cleavage system protein H [Theionarchaea archaeon]|nr:glycine cleavage system protein H [Theionarchaea archaeon]